jgi:hypothetical protein
MGLCSGALRDVLVEGAQLALADGARGGQLAASPH